jgi:hypothetical protein
MQHPFIKSLPFLYNNDFFLKIQCYYASIAKKMQTNTFFEWNVIQKLKFQNFPKFNWCISISYTIKNSINNSFHNFNFEVYIQIFKLYHIFKILEMLSVETLESF